MDRDAFDRLTKRLSRRAAAKGAGSGALLAALGLAGARPAAAAQGTSEATPATGGDATPGSFLFVQTAASGSFVPNPDAGTPQGHGTPVPGGGAGHLLTLGGHPGGTVFFSDRPARVFGEMPTRQFLDGLGFSRNNPPNAALVAQSAAGEDILVLELLSPTYDEAAGTVTYGANVLTKYDESGLAHAGAQQADDAMAETFTRASLFIDDCPAITDCYTLISQGPLPGGPIPTCFNAYVGCSPCNYQDIKYYEQVCNDTYAACDNCCTVFGGPPDQCPTGRPGQG